MTSVSLERESAREQVPRAARIRLQSIHHLSLTSPRWNNEVIQVINISTTGLGATNTNRPEDIEAGMTIPALLTLNQRTFPVLLKVAQITPEVIGFAFQGEVSQLQKSIFEYFVAEISGMEVTEVNPKLLKPDSRGEPHWYFGSNNSEVYLTVQHSRLTYFHITLLGNYIESYADKPPKFGYVVTQEGENKMKPDQSSLIRFTEQMPSKTLDLVIKFIRHIHSLNPSHKAFILSVLTEISDDQNIQNEKA